MNISDFRNVARTSNARVYLDTRTDELKVRRQTFLNRAVDWVRGKISPNPLATTERDVAHNRFLRAIADYSGYDSGDVSRAEALLSVDVIEGRALSSRRIREVIDDLDSRSSPATRDNRTTVAWMSGRGVDDALRERGAELDETERGVLAGRVDEAIHNAGGARPARGGVHGSDRAYRRRRRRLPGTEGREGGSVGTRQGGSRGACRGDRP